MKNKEKDSCKRGSGKRGGGSLDRLFQGTCLASACLAATALAAILIQVAAASAPVWQEFGLGFIASSDWDPVAGRFGALPAIAGTLGTTFIAIVISFPLAFCAALWLSDAHPAAQKALGTAIDLLAAIPSVIYGMWGVFVLAPILGRFTNGFSLLTAGLILALMALPYMCAIFRDVFAMTPQMLREAAYGVGCTKWEAAKDVVARSGLRGIFGGAFMGLGRALGETMAVLFVIGNVPAVPTSLTSGASTIASTLANQFAEAEGMHRSALFALGFLLLAIEFAIQGFSQWYLISARRRCGE